MEVKCIEYIKAEHYKYIANGRKAAIIINESSIITTSSHKDCLEFLYYDLEDNELHELERNVYKHESDLPIIIGDVFEKAVVLYYYDYIKNEKINNLLNNYCLEHDYKLFIDNSLCHR